MNKIPLEVVPGREDSGDLSLFWTFRPADAEGLTRSVQEAFRDVAYPGDDHLIVSGYPGCCAECAETQVIFQGRHWQDLARTGPPLQNFGWGGLALLKPEAWRYFLPTYLLVSLGGEEDAENALDCVISALTLWPPTGLAELSDTIDYVKISSDWFTARAFGFSAKQLECLAAFTEAVRTTDPESEERAALADYWKGRAAESGSARSSEKGRKER